ncbi:uncharacterized protein F4822DRAFT_242018 [Hypoxylon trugodes]|uniref:uncharacterized protein n=1 Tax=Hypoxylon trugodes TaxID=326681 RepID=UPI002196990B|nr:uncharacterized protein F4822DRAFT_242018 [Hypoxylon trugodes]KAI1388320.1 hypothetical protein F4822DRAFT_242018 [Hypoxylon trugodes]
MSSDKSQNRANMRQASEQDSGSEDRGTVFTGETRVPFRDRLAAMRQGVQERSLERRRSGFLPLALQAMPSPSPPPSPRPRRTTRPDSPFPIARQDRGTNRPTPLKPSGSAAPRKSPNLERVAKSNEDCSCDDTILDRRAMKKDEADSQRDLSNRANRRSRHGLTAPSSPSPLRASFNAAQMASLGSDLQAMLDLHEKKEKEKKERKGEDRE